MSLYKNLSASHFWASEMNIKKMKWSFFFLGTTAILRYDGDRRLQSVCRTQNALILWNLPPVLLPATSCKSSTLDHAPRPNDVTTHLLLYASLKYRKSFLQVLLSGFPIHFFPALLAVHLLRARRSGDPPRVRAPERPGSGRFCLAVTRLIGPDHGASFVLAP